MYHQFKELADIDITKEPMEVGPTTHYIMGGIRVDADTQMSTIPGLFAAGECAAGLHGANRLGGNSLSDLLVFGKRAGKYAAEYAEINEFAIADDVQIENAVENALRPFESDSGSEGENPYRIQADLQEMMQNLVGIVRTEVEMNQALDKIRDFQERAKKVVAPGNRQYNPGWHTALDLGNLLTVAEAITKAALERKESRGAHFRDDYAKKEDNFGNVNIIVEKDAKGVMMIKQEPIPELREDLSAAIEEEK